MKLYISGVHSGTNPSPGLGTARAIRQAYPDATLIAVDYSVQSSGLHHDVFDDVWLQPSWNQLDLELYLEQIRQRLNSDNSIWISGLDLEVRWLSQYQSQLGQLLVPPSRALSLTSKPAIAIHSKIPFFIPPYISISESYWALHSFCRRFDWQVWLKGPYYEARRVRSWEEFNLIREELSNTWSTEELFLQAHTLGYEESIALCAYEGNLLDCVYMTKRDLTNEGKTWAGRISEVPLTIHKALKEVIAELQWTGGAELEFVRDDKGVLHLIDWNARFPAWIYGAAIAGHNMPARLISVAYKQTFAENPPLSQEFTRVVIEIPTRASFPLPSLNESTNDVFGWSSKHPSGMPLLAKRLHSKTNSGLGKPAQLQDGILKKLLSLEDLADIQTPQRIFWGDLFKEYVLQIIQTARKEPVLPIRIAYSIKTNPSQDLLRIALETGLMAEAISQLEIQRAISVGFDASNIILNGPAKYWPSIAIPFHSLRAVFCDSVEELQNCISSNTLFPQVIGLRLRPPFLNSRFGVPIDEPNAYLKAVNALRALPHDQGIGFHFHFASSVLGVRNWWVLLEAALEWARQFEQLCQRQVVCFDVGGGWFPDDWITSFLPHLEMLADKAVRLLPHLREIVCEPGKALVQPFGTLIVRILEIRKMGDRKDILVDGAISDIPESWSYPHRIAVRDGLGDWYILGKGKDRIIGRICMESDIISTSVDLPDTVKEGDILAICDTGAYDRSTSYVFGQG